MTVTKEQIAVMINSKLGLSVVVCEEIVNRFFEGVLELAAEEKLILKNFGSFEVVVKKSRPGVNFHTKLPVVICEKKVIRFSPAKRLKSVVNGT